MSITIRFLGAAGTVTGSKTLLTIGGRRIMVDCGLFQGLKPLRLRNWEPLPVDPRSIDAVALTHAHIDHSGFLPALVRDGFRGDVLCTAATADYCRVLLPDSGHLHEKDADFANRHGFSRHHPALPLYTMADAERALEHLAPRSFDTNIALGDGLRLRFRRSGHILGAASVELATTDTTIVFSGDLGRYDDPVMVDPEPVGRADYLVVESTYGDRSHAADDPEAALAAVVERTVARGGTVVIPAFAVGRAQALLFHLQRLKAAGRLVQVPVFLDSPMAIDASEILCRHPADHRLGEAQCSTTTAIARYVRDVEASKALTANPVPKIIISASGMATGGRVLHHLKRYAPDPASTILFAGYQAAGTRGAAMIGGTDRIRIHGGDVPVRAEIANLDMLSAHADAGEILRWLGGFERPPRRTFITHGEPTAAGALRRRIETELGWTCHVPAHDESARLE